MRLFSLLFYLYSLTLNAQNLTLFKKIPFKNVHNVSADLNNAFYVTDDKGNLFQFDSLGKEINLFSPMRSASITVLDASRTMNSFLFYRDLQKYVFLNRFLATPELLSLDPEIVGYAFLAAPSLDNNLWVFDNTTFTLKKIDLKLQEAVIERSLDLLLDPNEYSVNYMKEYQNRVYLNDSTKGILIFDNLGNYSTTLPFKTSQFNFLNEDLYFIKKDSITFYNLYSEKVNTIKVACNDCKFSLVLKNRIVLFRENEILLFSKNKKD